MKTKMLILVAFSMIALPSCMHPVDQVLHSQADLRQETLEAHGRIAQGACDDVGQYAAHSKGGFTMAYAEEASAQPLR